MIVLDEYSQEEATSTQDSEWEARTQANGIWDICNTVNTVANGKHKHNSTTHENNNNK